MSLTEIEWTKWPGTIGETWNPTTGCNKVDRGCKYCYAEIMHRRLRAMGQEKYAAPFNDGAVAHEDTLDIPLRWNKPRTVFVNSMSDLFHKDLAFEFIMEVFQVMQLTPQHTYLILTKRPEIALKFWHWVGMKNGGAFKCPPNIWIGTSANDQKSGDERIPQLLNLDHDNLFISYEPATGPLNLTRVYFSTLFIDALRGNRRLKWIICGGESGPKADPMNPAWAQKVREDCRIAGVPFFFKQWGLWHPVTDLFGNYTGEMKKGRDKSFNLLDGETWQQFPSADKGEKIDDEIDFQPCDNCDLPDACEDFGCAIKNGVRKNYPIDGIF
jgi:protein gp37